jgi:hypothetical protein
MSAASSPRAVSPRSAAARSGSPWVAATPARSSVESGRDHGIPSSRIFCASFSAARQSALRSDVLLGAAAVRAGVGDQAEVEEHHPSGGRDHQVRGLDVAVDLADRVQRMEPAGEVGERRAEARLVVHARGDGGPGRGGPGRGGPGRGGLGAPSAVDRHGGGVARREGERGVVVRRGDPAAADVGEEVGALEELHREEPAAAGLEELSEVRGRLGMLGCP